MDISISNNLENILKAKIAEGAFSSMDEAITFAIQFTFIDNKISLEKINELNEKIEQGWLEMDAGKGRSSTAVFRDLREKYA